MKRILFAVTCLTIFGLPASQAATINISSPTVTETDSGTTTVTFNITCDPCTEVNALVDWSTSDGSATAGVDYVAASGQIDDFGNGTAIETYPIEVTVNGDLDVEGDETFTLDIDSTSVGCPSLSSTAPPATCAAPTLAAGTATIQNDDTNTPPSVAADNASVSASEGAAAGNTGTFSDADGDPVGLSASIGTVSETGSGTWSWSYPTTDGPDESGTVTITADDGTVTSQAAFSLTVNNVAPSNAADNASVTVNEGDPAGNTGTFSDVANDTVSLSVTAGPGTVTETAPGVWTWAHTTTDGPDESGTVTVTATDSDGAATDAGFSLTVSNVAPSNAADNASVTVNEGDPAGNTGTFSDVANDTVSLSVTAGPGTVTETAPGVWTWSYTTTDGPDESGTVTVTASDSDGAATDAGFSLTVNNVAPTGNADAYDTNEDIQLLIAAPGVLANDTDPGNDDLAATAQAAAATAAGGTVTLATDGSFTYDPPADFSGTDSFDYEVCDSDGECAAALATATIEVAPVNDVPQFTAGANQTVAEDSGAQPVPLWATGISPGAPALGNENDQSVAFSVIGNTNPGLFSAGPAIAPNGDLSYTPTANAFGTAAVTIDLSDNCDAGPPSCGTNGQLTAAGQTFTITVDNVNDPPTFISSGDVITETGTGEQTAPWASGISVGPANENQTPTFTVTSDCPASLLTAGPFVDPDGTLRFTPVDFAVGSCNVSAALSDGVDTFGPVGFTLELVTASAPIADPQSVETDGGNPLSITLTGDDPDDQLPLAFQVIEPVTDLDSGAIVSDSGPFRGTLDTFTPPNATGESAVVVYTPDAPFITTAALIATQSVLLKNNSEVISGDVVVNSSGGSLDVRNGANTPAGSTVKADSIDAQNNANIAGAAFCNGGDYSGNCDPLGLPAFDPSADPLPPFLIGGVNNDNVTVQKKASDTITPGIYGDILVKNGGTLSFDPGKYSVRSISTENKAALQFSGATEIKTAERMEIGNDSTIGDAGTAGDVIFYIAGSDGTGGGNPLKAVDLGNGNSVFATFYAPNGTILIDQNTNATGAFVAQFIEVQNNATVTVDSAFGEPADQFEFEVTDDIGLVSERATVLINEDTACRDDAGQIVSIAAYAGQAATDGAAAIDITLRGCESTDVPVTVTATSPAQGTLSGLPVGPEGPPYEFVVSYTPNGATNDRDSFDFTFDNGSSTATATVEINQPPCDVVEAYTTSTSVATDENNPLTITLSGCDPDDGVPTFSTDPGPPDSFVDCATCAISAPVGIVDNRPGFTSVNVVFTHNETQSTSTGFDFTVTAASGAATSTVSIEVDPLNLAPVANDDSFSGGLGGTITGNVLTDDTDANLDTLTATEVTPPSYASAFTLNADGSFVYVHNGTGNFSDSFQYAASDGDFSDTATVDITIVAANITVLVSKTGSPAGSEDSLITSSPAGINCGAGCLSDSASYMTTEPIRLNVQAATGFVFSSWGGDPDCADGQLTPIADRSCVANFVVDTSVPPTGDPVVVTILKDGAGFGTVTTSPAGIDCGATCVATISGDPRITLKVTPAAGSVFGGIAGGPGNDCKDAELEAAVDTTCAVTFDLAPQTLTIQIVGGTGSVDSEPGGISCETGSCSAPFVDGSTVTLSGRPDGVLPGNVNIIWGAPCVPGPTGKEATVLMTGNPTCTVDFNNN